MPSPDNAVHVTLDATWTTEVYFFPDSESAAKFITEISSVYRANFGPRWSRETREFSGDLNFPASLENREVREDGDQGGTEK